MKAIGAMKRANAPKRKKVSEAGGEKSDAAKGDRLRISAFQNFWKGVNENIVMLRAMTPNAKRDESLSLNKEDALQMLPPNSWLIHPSDPLKVGWDFFIGLVIFYSIITVPYKIGFQTSSTPVENNIEYAIAVLFLMDIILSFNAAYVSTKTGKLVVDRHVIVKSYMRFWFWIDTVSTIPFELVTQSASASSIRLVKVLRLIRLMKLFRIIKLSKFAKRFDDIHINPSILNVVKLTLQILFVAHLIACFWFYITTETITGNPPQPGVPESQLPLTWVTASGMTYEHTSDQYVAAFYWTITTMLSIGYGDILPTNSSERLYAMSVMMIGGVLFGAVIAQVTKFIESRNPQAKAFKARMDEVKAYLTEKSPSETTLRKEVLAAYNYYLMRKSTFAESGIFDDLPKGMLIKLVYTIYDKEIQEVSAFAHFNNRFVVAIVVNAQPFQARENDLIAQEFDVAEELIFIANGLVRLTLRRGVAETILVGYAGEGDYFGDFEYTKRSARVANYTAASSCSFLAVDYEILEQLEGDHADAHEDFMITLKNRMEHFEYLKQLPCSKKNSGDRYFEFAKILYNGEIRDSTESHMNQKEKNNFNHLVKYRCLLADPITHKIILHELTAFEILQMYVIHPKFSEKVLWDMFVGVLIVWSVLSAPVQIAFGTNGSPGVDWFLTIAFFADMIMAFRTAYLSEEDDAYVIYPEMIVHNYIHTWFPIDFVSTVPFDAIVHLFTSGTTNLSAIKLVKAVRLLRLMRLLRLSKLRSYLARLEDAFGIPPAIFNILSMYIQVLFIAHMVACLWWGMSAIMTQRAWFDDVAFSGSIRHASVFEQYITCLYWTLTTLATVGYGDLVPINTSERVLCVFVMIVGASVFGYIVANVSALMGQMDQANSRVVERVSEVTEYLNEKNCPKGLSESIIKHFRHMFNQKSAFDEESILKRLPRRLRNRLLLSQRGTIMEQIPIFRYLHNTSVAMYVFGLLDPLYFEVKQFILKEGELAHDVCFIISGSAHIFRKVRVNKVPKNGGGILRGGSLRGPSRKGVKRQGSVIGLTVKKTPTTENIPTITSRVSQLLLSKREEMSKKDDGKDGIEGKTTAALKANMTAGPWTEYHKIKMEHRERGRDFLGVLHQGSFIGHMALLKNTRHEASVVAYRAVSMYVLSRADIGKTTREHQHVSMFLQDALARAIRQMQDEVGKEHIKLARSEYLYNLRKGYVAKKEEAREINNKMVLSMKRNAFTTNSSGGVVGGGLGGSSLSGGGSSSAPNSYSGMNSGSGGLASSPLPFMAMASRGLSSTPTGSAANSLKRTNSSTGTVAGGNSGAISSLMDGGKSSPPPDAWTEKTTADDKSLAPEGIGMNGLRGTTESSDAVSAFTNVDDEEERTKPDTIAGRVLTKTPSDTADARISQEVKQKYAVTDTAKIVPMSITTGSSMETPVKENNSAGNGDGNNSAGSFQAIRKSGIVSPIFQRVSAVVKSEKTVFNDSNLLYDSDDDEDEIKVLARAARFKRVNSCPAFETILRKMEWQDDNRDTRGVIAAVLNENADGRELDRLALRAQTVAYDAKIRQEIEASRHRENRYAHSHGIDHHGSSHSRSTSRIASARTSGKGGGGTGSTRHHSPVPGYDANRQTATGASPRINVDLSMSKQSSDANLLSRMGSSKDNSVEPFQGISDKMDIHASIKQALHNVDAQSASNSLNERDIVESMEQILDGRFSGVNSPKRDNRSPRFLSPGPNDSPAAYTPVQDKPRRVSAPKTHAKIDRKELPQNRKKIERCNSFPSLLVDDMRHTALSHAVI